MNNKPKILWLVDVPGWAYHNRATGLAAKLTNYEHIILMVSRMTRNVFWQKIVDITPDITVMMHPSGFQAYDDLGQILFIATGTRAMTSGEREKAIIYYTNNELEGSELNRIVRDRLIESAGDIPIVSISQKSIKFGKNICVGNKPRKHESIYEQILTGLETLPDDTYVFLAEHDVLYHKSHFTDAPIESIDRKQLNYNINCYRCVLNGYTKRVSLFTALSQCSGLVSTLKSAIREKLALLNRYGYGGTGGRIEPGYGFGCSWLKANTYESEMPNVDIRHKKNFTKLFKMKIQCETIPYWGDYKKIREKMCI